jgi:Zn-dependent protease with chaperone function
MALDACGYFIFGHGWVFPRFVEAIALLEANLEWLFGSRLLARMAAILLSIPLALTGVLLAGKALQGLVAIAWREIWLLYPRVWSSAPWQRVDGILTSMCEKEGMAVPQIDVVSHRLPPIFSEASLFGLRSRISLSETWASRLTDEELAALFAHELHHLRGDAQRIGRLKCLSILGLFPVHYGLLLHNFAKKELDADDYAVRVMNDAKPLIGALVKLSMAGVNVSMDFTMGHGERTRFFRFMRVIFNDSFYGAAYPTIVERLARLKAMGAREPSLAASVGD